MVRKFLHQILSVSAARTYVPYQDLENKAMLLSVLESPNNFIEHLRRYTASLTTQMTFGFRTTSIEDRRFKQAFDVCYIGPTTSYTNCYLDLRPKFRAYRITGKLYLVLTLDFKCDVNFGVCRLLQYWT